jgi:hypothetical protein
VVKSTALGVKVATPRRGFWRIPVVPAYEPVLGPGALKLLKTIPAKLTLTVPAVLASPVPMAVAKADPEINTNAPAIVATLSLSESLYLLIFF